MIFPGVDSKVMPLQFEHSLMSPFFGRGIMIPFLHFFGTLPKRHTLLHSFVSCTSIIFLAPMLYHLWTYFVTSGRLPDLQVLDCTLYLLSAHIAFVYFQLLDIL